MIRCSIKEPLIIFLIFGMFVFLLPCGAFAQNSPPVAVNDVYETKENTTLTVAPEEGVLDNDTDSNNEPLTAIQVSGPANGSLTLNSDGSFTYAPNKDYFGSDSFTYKANDGAADSETATVTITVQQVQEVFVDIKPGSCPNPINVKSWGVLPVAILGTSAFDVTTIDRASIRLMGVAPIRSSLEDVATPFTDEVTICDSCTDLGPDGYMDLTLKFSTQSIVKALGVVTDGECIVLELTGELTDGTLIVGEDVVQIQKKGNSWGWGKSIPKRQGPKWEFPKWQGPKWK